MSRVRCCLLGALASALALAVACGPSKPPMTPDSETEQQLPDIGDGGAAVTPPAAATNATSK